MLDVLNMYEMAALSLLCLLLLVGIYFMSRSFINNSQKRSTKRIVNKISGAHLQEVPLDMGEDQYAYFDYILLRKDGILVLEFKDYAGHIYASEQINEWTQVIGSKSYKFANPFFELERKVELLRQVIGNEKIDTVILFTDKADFPKGRPQNVLLLKELKNIFSKTKASDISEAGMIMWLQLQTYLSKGA